MRRSLLVFAICAFFGCGIDAVATKTFDQPPVDAGEDTSTNLPPKGDASEDAPIDARVDAPIDAAVEAEAGIVFTPSHIPAGSFSLVAGPVSITAPTTVNTTDRTIDLNGGGAAVSADIAIVNNIAVWSVGAFTTTDKLIVTGDHPLLIVASKDVSIGGVVTAFAVLEKPGPGGSLPSAGTGKGSDGTKAGNDASGGGGAGHGTAGAVGGNKSGQTGGAAGPVANLSGAALVGGPGGGNGGGFTAAGNCAGRGRGGAGGGAFQISALGKITITGAASGIDVGGGAGAGGCKDSGMGFAYSGGGGGGAGGLVVLESVVGIQIDLGTTIEASGGGGGEGGDNGNNGNDGVGGPFPSGIGIGGNGGAGNGGNGGNGGVGGPFGFVSLPGPGANGGDTGGGGGGATGRVFLRTRGATLTVTGAIAGERTDDQTF